MLVVVSFAQAAVVAGMVAGADALWALLPLMALLGFGVAVSQPAEFALVPAAAGEDVEVARANGLMETVRSLGFTAGPVLGGALGAAGLLRLALALNALSFAVVGVAALVLRARRRRRAAARRAGPRPRRLRLPPPRARPRDRDRRRRRRARRVLDLGHRGAVLRHRRARRRAARLRRAADLLDARHGRRLGGARAPRAARSSPRRRSPRSSLQGAGIAGAALSPVLWMALIGFAFGGVAHGVKNVLLRTLIHERVPDALRGRAFAAYNGARNGAELGALALGGLVVGAFGARPALLAAGLGPAPIGLVCLFLLTTTLQRRVIHARFEG